MKLLPEDPRITAYALGEIEDPQERAEIEAAVAASPELQHAVADIRSMGALLGTSFAGESAPVLSEFERAKLEAEPTGTVPKGRLLSWPLLTSAAAIALLAILVVPQLRQKEETFTYQAQPREAASPVASSFKEVNEVNTLSTPPTLNNLRGDFIPDDGGASGDYGLAVETPSGEKKEAAKMMSYADFFKQNTAEDEVEESSLIIDSISSESNFGDYDSVVALRASPPPTAPKPDLQTQVVIGRTRSAKSASLIASDAFSAEPVACFMPPPMPTPVAPETGMNTENYDAIEASDFRSPRVAPLSTFSIDVDTASYANVRRFLNQGQLPPADAVRIEELVNYFNYDDAAPTKSLDAGGDPFAVHMAQMDAPWNPENRLLRIALKGYEMPWAERPASNLVFLMDVSGSMNQANKLPLVKEALDLLIQRLDERDRVAIVVYAGASGLVLPSTTANNRETIAHALNNLSAGGSTNAGAGIELAYKTARKHFIEGGNNRVILCTDGDFNVGQTNRGDLAGIVEAQAEEGVSLTVLGFGMGNYKDGMLETLSNKGKGTYAYVDSQTEARKVFLEDLASNIFKIAKDVKIQVEFNPAHVQAYRLIGYENRRLKVEDFNNDAKKAGDIGPGHSIVALYEIVPPSAEFALSGVDALRYQTAPEPTSLPSEVATVKLRYKQPNGDVSKLIKRSVQNDDFVQIEQASDDLRFSAAVAAFGLRLSGSAYVADYGYEAIVALALDSLGKDSGGHRSEFVQLVRKASSLEAKQ